MRSLCVKIGEENSKIVMITLSLDLRFLSAKAGVLI